MLRAWKHDTPSEKRCKVTETVIHLIQISQVDWQPLLSFQITFRELNALTVKLLSYESLIIKEQNNKHVITKLQRKISTNNLLGGRLAPQSPGSKYEIIPKRRYVLWFEQPDNNNLWLHSNYGDIVYVNIQLMQWNKIMFRLVPAFVANYFYYITNPHLYYYNINININLPHRIKQNYFIYIIEATTLNKFMAKRI